MLLFYFFKRSLILLGKKMSSKSLLHVRDLKNIGRKTEAP